MTWTVIITCPCERARHGETPAPLDYQACLCDDCTNAYAWALIEYDPEGYEAVCDQDLDAVMAWGRVTEIRMELDAMGLGDRDPAEEPV